jgi:hypothetical protein
MAQPHQCPLSAWAVDPGLRHPGWRLALIVRLRVLPPWIVAYTDLSGTADRHTNPSRQRFGSSSIGP